MLMPEVIIVESWRANTASSPALTDFMNESSMLREACFSATSRTISPRCLSCSETACFESPSTSPRAFTPATSIALNTYTLIAALLRGGPSAEVERLGAEQAAELLGRRGARFGEFAADLPLSHQPRQRC